MPKITVRMVGPFATAEGSAGTNPPVVRYRIKSISGAVTLYGRGEGEPMQYRPGDLVTEEVAKGLALDYEILTEEYKEE